MEPTTNGETLEQAMASLHTAISPSQYFDLLLAIARDPTGTPDERIDQHAQELATFGLQDPTINARGIRSAVANILVYDELLLTCNVEAMDKAAHKEQQTWMIRECYNCYPDPTTGRKGTYHKDLERYQRIYADRPDTLRKKLNMIENKRDTKTANALDAANEMSDLKRQRAASHKLAADNPVIKYVHTYWSPPELETLTPTRVGKPVAH